MQIPKTIYTYVHLCNEIIKNHFMTINKRVNFFLCVILIVLKQINTNYNI